MPSSLSAKERTQRARLAALTRWSREDPKPATEKARKGLDARFEREADPEGVLDPVERRRRAQAAKRAYFQRMAYERERRRRASRESA